MQRQVIGWGLARTVPYADARIINLSRSTHPDFETIHLDLTRPETYAGVQQHFESELREISLVSARSSSTTPFTRPRPAS